MYPPPPIIAESAICGVYRVKDLSSKCGRGMIDFQIKGVQFTMHHRLLSEALKQARLEQAEGMSQSN